MCYMTKIPSAIVQYFYPYSVFMLIRVTELSIGTSVYVFL